MPTEAASSRPVFSGKLIASSPTMAAMAAAATLARSLRCRNHRVRDERQGQHKVQWPVLRHLGANENPCGRADLPGAPQSQAGSQVIPMPVRRIAFLVIVGDRDRVALVGEQVREQRLPGWAQVFDMGATEALYSAWRRLTTKTTIRITRADVPAPTNWAATNCAEPRKDHGRHSLCSRTRQMGIDYQRAKDQAKGHHAQKNWDFAHVPRSKTRAFVLS